MNCKLRPVSAALSIALKPSAAGLIFDVTDQGAGVDVFQPFELVAGADALASHSQVKDGDREVTLSIRRLGAGDTIGFTIDVVDTLGPRGITVSGSEIQGALVRGGTPALRSRDGSQPRTRHG
jgi:hypothetical protein